MRRSTAEATDKDIDALVYKLRPKGVPAGEAGVGYGLRSVPRSGRRPARRGERPVACG